MYSKYSGFLFPFSVDCIQSHCKYFLNEMSSSAKCNLFCISNILSLPDTLLMCLSDHTQCFHYYWYSVLMSDSFSLCISRSCVNIIIIFALYI